MQEQKENNLMLFAAVSAICSAMILGIMFVFISQFSTLNYENKNLKSQLEEIKELSKKNNQTLEQIKLNLNIK